MRTSRFTDEQIIGIVKEYEAGAKLAELCRRHGVSQQGDVMRSHYHAVAALEQLPPRGARAWHRTHGLARGDSAP